MAMQQYADQIESFLPRDQGSSRGEWRRLGEEELHVKASFGAVMWGSQLDPNHHNNPAEMELHRILRDCI